MTATCKQFLWCDRQADGFTHHPILGLVPSCQQCAAKLEQPLILPGYTRP